MHIIKDDKNQSILNEHINQNQLSKENIINVGPTIDQFIFAFYKVHMMRRIIGIWREIQNYKIYSCLLKSKKMKKDFVDQRK